MSSFHELHVKLIESFIKNNTTLFQEKLRDEIKAIGIGNINLEQILRNDLKISESIGAMDIESSFSDEIKSGAPFDLATLFVSHSSDLKAAILNVNSLLKPNGVFCFSIALHNLLDNLCNDLTEKHPTYKDIIVNCLNSWSCNVKLGEELPKMLAECGFTIDCFELMPLSDGVESREIVNDILPLLRNFSINKAGPADSMDFCDLLEKINENHGIIDLQFVHCIATKSVEEVEEGEEEKEEDDEREKIEKENNSEENESEKQESETDENETNQKVESEIEEESETPDIEKQEESETPDGEKQEESEQLENNEDKEGDQNNEEQEENNEEEQEENNEEDQAEDQEQNENETLSEEKENEPVDSQNEKIDKERDEIETNDEKANEEEITEDNSAQNVPEESFV